VKSNSFPFKLIGLEALASRLSRLDLEKHRIEEEVRIVRAGVNGEKRLVSVFEKYVYRKPHAVFHDLNLKSSGLFQIDTLFLSRQGATILEMKNIAGRIHFPAEQNQMMRTLDNGKIDAFECPSVQLERNKLLLREWFIERGINIPIQGAVVFSTPQQHFESSREGLKVLFPLEIPVYLQRLLEMPPSFSESKLDTLKSKLLKAHHEYDPFPICKKYNIDVKKIKTGVRCDQCGLYGMISISRGWICEACRYVSRDAHRQAILERFMLIGNTMTNSQCRKFLHLSCGDKVKRIIKRMEIPVDGMNKGRTYQLTLKELEKQLIRLEKK